MPRSRWVGTAVAFLVLGLVLTLPVSAAMAATRASPELTPTIVCSCGTVSAEDANSSSELRGHGPPPPSSQPVYDEQLGITFAQSYTSMEYNVTAVAQTDPTLDTGPAYLLDGLSNSGFWYQVGVSYNWGPGQTPGTGFDMNYEVFDAFGDSVYPTQGGGLEAFSGPVHEGDTITLDLYFGTSGDVVMIAEDLNTGAYADQTFSAEGASYFAGLPNEVANANGFFTGLMTEWYHGAPYYANLAAVTYSTTVSVSSGWMWMDEWNPNTDAVVFGANASAPSSFASEPSTLREFSYNSTTEYADGTEFVTGALSSTSTGTGSTSHSLPYVAVAAFAVAVVIVVIFMARRRGPQETVTAPTYPSQPASAFCHHCGSQLEPDGQFCANCGAHRPSDEFGSSGVESNP